MLIGGGSRHEWVEGGLTLDAWCESCQAGRTFAECQLHDQIELYFIPVVKGELRRLACTHCGLDMEMPRPAAHGLPDPYRGITDEQPEPRFANLEVRDGTVVEYLRLGSSLRVNVIPLSEIRQITFSGPMKPRPRLPAMAILVAAALALALFGGTAALSAVLLVGVVGLFVWDRTRPGPHLRVETAASVRTLRLRGPVDERKLERFIGSLKSSP